MKIRTCTSCMKNGYITIQACTVIANGILFEINIWGIFILSGNSNSITIITVLNFEIFLNFAKKIELPLTAINHI